MLMLIYWAGLLGRDAETSGWNHCTMETLLNGIIDDGKRQGPLESTKVSRLSIQHYLAVMKLMIQMIGRKTASETDMGANPRMPRGWHEAYRTRTKAQGCQLQHKTTWRKAIQFLITEEGDRPRHGVNCQTH